ncbi:hypothetical protein WT67_24525 [Burkholderia stagnalis]|uniref:hypothetical protein n=1 Tax=Burkholderia stagnalis TaxID=1503054 RepID=UPI00075F623D|nr:hypothetical protein [Burkholderia stagnalis]KVO44852.1 hypothetical protein WT17_11385 [Burkholderia stagnalis]KVO66498.1 hypothetical protein WT19_27340 [Burkholderia stagnalis]KVW54777.1 hypothetical protein WT28_31665 [Burkholderia stagnalis]KVW78536.1 hypothetical protein WT29_17870 [Burkholderia stagnalis]KVX70266.1 hypothetical protein WT34_22465 [Burkholderia stagnalis]
MLHRDNPSRAAAPAPNARASNQHEPLRRVVEHDIYIIGHERHIERIGRHSRYHHAVLPRRQEHRHVILHVERGLGLAESTLM